MYNTTEVKEERTERILSKIDPDIRETLNIDQVVAIEKAIVDNLPEQKDHPVDIHGVLPLFFRRLYFVFSAGKDTRASKEHVEDDDREETPAHRMVAFVIIILLFASIFGNFIVLGYEYIHSAF